MVNWFRRNQTFEERDPQIPLEPYELENDIQVISFAPKPDELVRAVAATERIATPDEPRALTVDWQRGPPVQEGVYWWVDWGQDPRDIRQCVVLDFGGRLCVRERRGGACKYTAVAALRRHWAGPLPIPSDMTLEDLEAA